MLLKRQWRKAVLAGAATMAAAGVGGGLVFAMSTSNSAPAQAASGISAQVSPSATASPPPGGPKAPQAVTDAVNQFLHDLAGHLNVSDQALRDALQQTALDQVDQAEQSGKLTTDQANKLRDAINKAASGDSSGFQGLIPGLLPGIIGKGGLNPDKPNHQDKPTLPGAMGKLGASLDATASFLGTDRASLLGELASGKSLAQVAEDHGKTRDELKSFLSGQAKQLLQQAVTAGKLDQAKADALQSAFDSHVDSIIDNTHLGPFANPNHGPHGPKPGSTPTPGATP